MRKQYPTQVTRLPHREPATQSVCITKTRAFKHRGGGVSEPARVKSQKALRAAVLKARLIFQIFYFFSFCRAGQPRTQSAFHFHFIFFLQGKTDAYSKRVSFSCSFRFAGQDRRGRRGGLYSKRVLFHFYFFRFAGQDRRVFKTCFIFCFVSFCRARQSRPPRRSILQARSFSCNFFFLQGKTDALLLAFQFLFSLFFLQGKTDAAAEGGVSSKRVSFSFYFLFAGQDRRGRRGDNLYSKRVLFHFLFFLQGKTDAAAEVVCPQSAFHFHFLFSFRFEGQDRCGRRGGLYSKRVSFSFSFLQGKTDAAAEVVNDSGDAAAAYHLAKQCEETEKVF